MRLIVTWSYLYTDREEQESEVMTVSCRDEIWSEIRKSIHLTHDYRGVRLDSVVEIEEPTLAFMQAWADEQQESSWADALYESMLARGDVSSRQQFVDEVAMLPLNQHNLPQPTKELP
jgi:hypothetical protein